MNSLCNNPDYANVSLTEQEWDSLVLSGPTEDSALKLAINKFSVIGLEVDPNYPSQILKDETGEFKVYVKLLKPKEQICENSGGQQEH